MSLIAVTPESRWRLVAPLIVLLLAAPLLGALPLARPAVADAVPPVLFGSAIHPEDVFAKRSVTKLDLAHPGLRTPEDAERAAVAAVAAGLTLLRVLCHLFLYAWSVRGR